jgi:hypothetical protein
MVVPGQQYIRTSVLSGQYRFVMPSDHPQGGPSGSRATNMASRGRGVPLPRHPTAMASRGAPPTVLGFRPQNPAPPDVLPYAESLFVPFQCLINFFSGSAGTAESNFNRTAPPQADTSIPRERQSSDQIIL